MNDPFLTQMTIIYLASALTLEANDMVGEPLPTLVVNGLETANSMIVILLCVRIISLYFNGSFGL